MTATQSLQIYEILNLHFKSKEDAKAVVQSIEKVIDEKVEDKTIVFEKIVTKDIDVLRNETKTQFSVLKEEIYKAFATKDDLYSVKVDLIKWVFAFFVTLALMILGLYIKK
jgi:hypothetical protein